jgi:excisionase family DNA binding protein
MLNRAPRAHGRYSADLPSRRPLVLQDPARLSRTTRIPRPRGLHVNPAKPTNTTETSTQSGQKLEGLLDIPRAAKVLGISPKTLRDHVLHRRIDYVKIGGRVLFRPDTLWDFIERNTIHALQ